MSTERTSFSVLFFVKKTRLLKNGEAPIRMRISVNRQIVDIVIKRSVPVEHWNQAKECSNARNKVALELNHYLESIRARIMQIHREIEIDGKTITAKTIRDRYYGNDEDHRTLVEVYSEHNEKCRALIGKDYTESTVGKFDGSLACLKEYIKYQYKQDDIYLSEVNTLFVQNLEFYLKTKRNLQNNSAIKHLKSLKKIIRIALANEWIKKDPFIGIQFKHEETCPDFLSQEELQILMEKNFTIPRLDMIRDVFVFCCMTGLAFIDVKQLSSEHIFKDNNDNLWIRKSRQKTNNMCNIPLLEPAIQLIEKYKNYPECKKNNVLLPVISNQRMNAYLKEIADLCGINKKLTTHVARHTCATVVLLANEVSIENVAKILGHSNTKMTHHYAKVLDSSIMRDMEKVRVNFKI